jgi:uncharacterized RDD family membrane protein YckC
MTMPEFDNPYASPSTLPPIDSAVHQSELADRSTRFVAALIDGLITLPIVFPLGFAIGAGVSYGLGESALTTLVSPVLGGAMGIGVFVALHGYLLATRGQTIGKMLLKIKIVRDSGEMVPFPELFLKRYLIIQVLSMIPFIGMFIGILDALFIFRSNRKCLHDDFAGTKVIKVQ